MSAHCRNDGEPYWQDVEDEQIVGDDPLDSLERSVMDFMMQVRGAPDGELAALYKAEVNKRYRREFAIRNMTKRALLRSKSDIQFDFDNAKTDDEWTKW